MFKNLLHAPQREAFETLKKKVEENRHKPRVHEYHRVDPCAALARIKILEGRILESLGWYETWTEDLDHPSSEIRRRWHRGRVDEAIVEIRRLVHALTLRRVVQYLAAVRIQRKVLKLLYQPRPGTVPRISRALVDEGFLVIGNGDSDGES